METLSGADLAVVKVGSALLADRRTGALRADWLASLAQDIADLRAAGTRVIVCSSGSIALGRAALGMAPGELPLERSQAAAAVGSIRLAGAWQDAFEPHGIVAAQVLLTLDDSEDRRRYLNTRATLATLVGLGTVPVVNENDTVATDEIRYGDNDRLAAQVAVTAGAGVLVLLSDIDGLYTAPPGTPGAMRLDRVSEITPEIEAMAGDAGSGLSKGGMKTKLMAARAATQAGCAMCIADGREGHPLRRLREDGPATWFAARGDPARARKAWIGAMKPRGVISVDAGAARALAAGRSLLPAGVTGVQGDFGRGDPVIIRGPGGGELGHGLVRYDAAEARLVAGRRTGDIEAVLGYPGRAALIHRDDMAT